MISNKPKKLKSKIIGLVSGMVICLLLYLTTLALSQDVCNFGIFTPLNTKIGGAGGAYTGFTRSVEVDPNTHQFCLLASRGATNHIVNINTMIITLFHSQ